MKKLLTIWLFAVSFSLTLSAQDFWTADELTASYSGMSSQYYENIQSEGIKPQKTFFPNLSWGGNIFRNKASVIVMLYHEGKYLCLAFNKDNGKQKIYVCESQSNTQLNNELYEDKLNGGVIPDAKIDFPNIFYNENINSLVIPFGRDKDFWNFYATIVINFKENSDGISSAKATNDGKVSYYDVSGLKVDPKSSKKQVLIEKNGSKSKKIIF